MRSGAIARSKEDDDVDGRQPRGSEDGRRAELDALGEERPPGLLAELWEFMATNRKWWLMPIVLMLLLVGGLIVVSGTPAGAFIYTLF